PAAGRPRQSRLRPAEKAADRTSGGSVTDAVVRNAVPVDVAAICRFGERYIEDHYTPIIGPEAAAAQVRDWWNAETIAAAVDAGLVVVAEVEGEILGVAQRGRHGDGH